MLVAPINLMRIQVLLPRGGEAGRKMETQSGKVSLECQLAEIAQV